MKPSEIEVGKTYVNRGKGTTERKVLDMGNTVVPDYYKGALPVVTIGVKYMQIKRQGRGKVYWLSLSSFAAWAGKEVEPA